MLHKDSHSIQQQVRPTSHMKLPHGSRKLYTKKQQIFDLVATQISLQHKIHGQQNKTTSFNNRTVLYLWVTRRLPVIKFQWKDSEETLWSSSIKARHHNAHSNLSTQKEEAKHFWEFQISLFYKGVPGKSGIHSDTILMNK